ncbi:MAG TPA: thioredoxin family protein [Thermoguttaceae bacterium]|nr:thioredoxin family protein [Thermoguttaceae bacterium]
MRSLEKCAVLLALLAVVGLALSCQAAETKLKIGDKAPDFKDLPGVDGKKHSLSDYADAKLVVVVFTCNHCPVAKAYEDRIIQFQKDYKDKGVQVVAINVNNIPADRLDKMIERAKEKGFNFPYLYDETQQSGREYGATCTPHFFVLCQERKIAYMGAMDDNNNPDKVKEHWLRDAIDALLAGKTPPKQVTQQRGCSIKWDK